MRKFASFAVPAILLVGLIFSQRSLAQRAADSVIGMPPAPAGAPEAQLSDKKTPAGPTIYVDDQSGNLATIDIHRKTVHIIGNTGAALTDIAFAPDGTLYGVSFSQFFRIDATTAQATLIGNMGPTDINALTIDSNGTAYAAGNSTSALYTINLTTGAATAVGAPANGYNSEGDLVFYNDKLILAGSRNGSTTVPTFLVDVNPQTGAQSHAVRVDVSSLYGLASTGKNELYGFANTTVYRLNPKAGNIHGRSKRLFDVARTGLGPIFGAAYNGNFQP
jgi:hypothetical protein